MQWTERNEMCPLPFTGGSWPAQKGNNLIILESNLEENFALTCRLFLNICVLQMCPCLYWLISTVGKGSPSPFFRVLQKGHSESNMAHHSVESMCLHHVLCQNPFPFFVCELLVFKTQLEYIIFLEDFPSLFPLYFHRVHHAFLSETSIVHISLYWYSYCSVL